MNRKTLDKQLEAQDAIRAWFREPTTRDTPLPKFILRQLKKTARILNKTRAAPAP